MTKPAKLAWPIGPLEYQTLPDTFNMASLLVDRHLEAGAGEREALLHPGGRVTYRDLWEAVNRAAHLVRTLGVESEQRVLLLLPDSPEFVYLFLGAMKAGAVPVPVTTLAAPDEYEYYLRDSRARLLVTHVGLYEKVEGVWPGIPGLRATVVVGGAPAGCLAFEILHAAQPAFFDPAATHKDDMAYWLYSSGTTGRPKAVVHLHHDMVFCIESYARHVLAMTPEDRTFAVPRLFFSYGLRCSLYLPLWSGSSAVLLPERPSPAGVLEAIARYRPTLFFSVPTSYAALLREAEGREPDLSSLRLAISAGEPLPAPLYLRWMERFGVELLDGLGATEVGFIYISNRPGAVRPGASGQLLPGYEARILDGEGREVGPDEVGDLWVRGESVAVGYWNQHPKTKATFVGEWYRTGDRYTRDADGYYFYQGRADDLLRVGGQWVSPLEVESALLEHPAVLECAVVGGMDADGLEKPHAYVVLRPGAVTDGLAETLRAHVRARLARFKVPRWVTPVPELPKTSTGKVQRFKLRELNTPR